MSLSYFLFAAAPIKDDQQHLIFLMDFWEIENGEGGRGRRAQDKRFMLFF